MLQDWIAELIARLDDDSVEVAEDAKAELMALRAVCLEPLMAAVPSLKRNGVLSAIEVFEDLGDPRAAGVLIALLGHTDVMVRERSARALKSLRAVQAVPELRAAYERCRSRAEPLDEMEPVALRNALTALGGRIEVVSLRTVSLARSIPGVERVWPARYLTEVIRDLAAHNQAVLYFQLWTSRGGTTYWVDHHRLNRVLDRSAPWPEVVAAARDAALMEATFPMPVDDLYASIEWIDEQDW